MPPSPTPSLTIVDAFTDRPFAGNPAAVMLLDGERPDEWLQAVAAEMNLSETAFLSRLDGGRYGLRWFTPALEVELCGHATLAAAHVLWTGGHTDTDILRFATRSGELWASRADGLIWLDFPSLPPRAIPAPEGLIAALGLDEPPRFVGTTAAGPGPTADLLVAVDDEAAVRALAPDFGALARIDCRGVIVTAAGTGGVDLVSRFFGPAAGIPEDPVTGSAHCLLAPYWAERLGRRTLTGRQVSRRGGELRLELRGDRVRIGGRAVTVARTELVATAGEWGDGRP